MTDQQRWAAAYTYNPDTGLFFHRGDKRGPIKNGAPAGARHAMGYLYLSLSGERKLGHRVAWLLTHGEWPEAMIDHVNGDPSDNRLCNLRAATSRENQRNKRCYKNNTSGIKGVSWDRSAGKWIARLKVPERYLHLGYFSEKGAAAAAYAEAANKHYGDFARVA